MARRLSRDLRREGANPSRKEAPLNFHALNHSLDAIRQLREPLAALTQRDPDLARQLRRAAASVALNLSEGLARTGRDRIHLWRVAQGSANEVVACLRVGEAWGDLDQAALAAPLALYDRVLAILWRLTR
jgi:four helix bundle protein